MFDVASNDAIRVEPIKDASFTRTAREHRFLSEAELVKSAKEIMIPYLGESFGILDEFDCNDGIADLVSFKLRQNWMSTGDLKSISPRWAAALSALPYRRSFTLDWFGKTNLVSRGRALQTLREFESAGYCEKLVTENCWSKIRQPVPIVTNICAVEAKLRDWRRALSQATRYRRFAHHSWVLLDEASVQPALANICQFEKFNVGLVSISKNGIFHSYFSPQIRQPSDPWRFWFANVLIAREISFKENFVCTN